MTTQPENVQITSAAQARGWIESLDFEALVRVNWPKLHTYSGDPDFTRDCVAEVIVKLLGAPEKLVGKTVGLSYVTTAVQNYATDTVRSGDVSRTVPLADSSDDFMASDAESSSVEDRVVERVGSQREAQEWMLLATGLKPQLQQLFALVYVSDHALSDRELGQQLGVDRSRANHLRSEVRAALLAEKARFDEGLLCKAHLTSEDEDIRERHMNHCSLCALHELRLQELRPTLAALAPASLLALLPSESASGGFFAQMLARFTEPITTAFDFAQRRYAEASVVAKAGTAVVAAVAVASGGTAIVHEVGDGEEKTPPPVVKSDPPKQLYTPIFPNGEGLESGNGATTDSNKGQSEPKKEEETNDAAETPPALTPEAAAEPVPQAPAQTTPGGGGSAGSGVGDLAP